MRIETTVREIRALVLLAELDQGAKQATTEAHRRRRINAALLLPRTLLDRYQSLLETGRTPVVAAIERGTCSGCHVRLPTMLEHLAGRMLAVHTCPHCRRMLYAPRLLGDDAEALAKESPAPRPPKPDSRRERSG